LKFIPFLTLEPFPLLQKPEQSGHAVKSLMTIPAKVVQFRMLNHTTKTKESLHIYETCIRISFTEMHTFTQGRIF
jgi:hypothetical protein